MNRAKNLFGLVVAGSAGLSLAFGGPALYERYRRSQEVEASKSGLVALRDRLAAYAETHGRWPRTLEEARAAVASPAWRSPCSQGRSIGVIYLPPTEGDPVVLTDVGCNATADLSTPLARKRGLAITRSGRPLDFVAYGDPSSPDWWSLPPSSRP